jgi:hypothetical protein
MEITPAFMKMSKVLLIILEIWVIELGWLGSGIYSPVNHFLDAPALAKEMA